MCKFENVKMATMLVICCLNVEGSVFKYCNYELSN
jgi:hypothetical protein